MMEKEKKLADPSMEVPLYFRCPISMEIMKDPVTISTGVTYERKNIEKWFFTYKKTTCPATNQKIDHFDLITPNHTLKRLILSWQEQKTNVLQSPSSTSSQQTQAPIIISCKHDELLSLFSTIQSTPFKVSLLKKLRSILELGNEIQTDFVQSGGIEVLSQIIIQTLYEHRSDNFITFRACEEAISILDELVFSDESIWLQIMIPKPDCIKAMALVLQRGSAEGRLHSVSIFRKMVKVVEYDFSWVVQDQSIDLSKALLDLLSDENINSKVFTYALDVLFHIIGPSKKNRIKAVEAGAICVLVELLPDSNRPKCEKILMVIKLLCECAEGRLALVEHGFGIAAVSKKILRVSDTATKLGLKIFWLICNSHPSIKVLEDMLVLGSVKKFLALVHYVNIGQSSIKNKAIKILKLHGNTWQQYPCFPCELKNCLTP